jgi:hypothetical protein
MDDRISNDFSQRRWRIEEKKLQVMGKMMYYKADD